jgi:hypothetical protein
MLGLINFAPDDLAPVFGAMLNKAPLDLCGAAFGNDVQCRRARRAPKLTSRLSRENPFPRGRAPYWARSLPGVPRRTQLDESRFRGSQRYSEPSRPRSNA